MQHYLSQSSKFVDERTCICCVGYAIEKVCIYVVINYYLFNLLKRSKDFDRLNTIVYLGCLFLVYLSSLKTSFCVSSPLKHLNLELLIHFLRKYINVNSEKKLHFNHSQIKYCNQHGLHWMPFRVQILMLFSNYILLSKVSFKQTQDNLFSIEIRHCEWNLMLINDKFKWDKSLIIFEKGNEMQTLKRKHLEQI
jgi:hypothetical protein